MDKKERNIRVTGKGDISVKPDVTVIVLDMSDIKTKYEDALASSAEDSKEIKDLLEGFGLKREDLKTTSFRVDSKYESYENKKKECKYRFIGYEYHQTLKFRFPSDNVLLGKILYGLSKCGCEPEFRIHYTTSDPEGAKNALIGKAIEDARIKAKVLTDAAGVKLGEIDTIDYSWSTMRFESRPSLHLCNMSIMPMLDSYDIDIEPDDIHESDTVTVIWSIS